DFAGAVMEARRLPQDALAAFPAAERTRHLRVLLDIARFQGNGSGASALEAELRATGAKAEETAKPSARFESLLSGSAVDLARAAQTLMDLLASRQLSSRESSLLAYLSGLALIELGEYALAEEVLTFHPPAGEDPWLGASVAGRLGFVKTELGDYES